MPDWKEYVRRRLELGDLDPHRENRIVEDLAEQLEDFYGEALEGGAGPEKAAAFARAQVSDWDRLGRELRSVEKSHRLPAADRWRARARARGGLWLLLADLQKDLLHGARTLRRAPGFTLAAVLTLAIGIGAITVTFTYVEAILIRPLPFPDPDRLVMVRERTAEGEVQPAAYANLLEWRREARTFVDLAGMIAQSVNLTGEGEPARLRGGFVSDGFFRVAGVSALHGRLFQPGEDQPGGERVVVLSHPVWTNRFGGDPGLLGRRLELNGEPFTVIGILPEEFSFPIDYAGIWLPMAYVTQDLERAWWNFGRIRPGVDLEQAERELNAMLPGLAARFPELNAEVQQVQLETLHSRLVRRIRPTLWIFLGAVALVLLIASANVANLMLSRGLTRERELAIRTALGAARWRVVRQLLTEALLLALLGAGVGLLLAQWGAGLFRPYFESSMGWAAPGLNPTVLAFTLLVTTGAGVLAGLAPAWQFSRPDLAPALKEGGRSLTPGRRLRWLSNAFVVGQVGLAIVLLVGAGLLLRSFSLLLGESPGFRPEGLLTLEYRIPEGRYPSEARQVAFHEEVIERVRAVPGVRSAALVRRLPFSYNRGFVPIRRPDQPEPARGQEVWAFRNEVGEDAFRTLEIPVRRGRAFQRADGSGRFAVVNETMARRLWEGSDPIGRPVLLADESFTVIGVVGDVRYFSLEDEHTPQVYLHTAARPSIFTALAIRTAGEPMDYAGQVQAAIWAVDQNQPMWKIRTADSMIDSSFLQRRMTLGVLAAFAAAALLMAAVGIYGVLAHAVSRQSHELAVRMAFGAGSGDVVRLVVRRGVLLAGMGVGLGLLAAVAASRLLGSLVFGISTTDWLTFAGVTAVFFAVALLACYLPARRAARVDLVTLWHGHPCP